MDELLTLERLKKENVAIISKMEKLRVQHEELNKLTGEKDKELLTAQFKMADQTNRIKMLTETLTAHKEEPGKEV